MCTFLKNGLISGNILKNWREVNVKKSRLLMSAVPKIKFQNIGLNLFALPCIWYRTRDAAFVPDFLDKSSVICNSWSYCN
jgi:hypothetical protein